MHLFRRDREGTMEETDRPAAFSRSQISPLPSLHMDMRWPPVTQRGSKGYVACYRLHGTASSASAVAVRHKVVVDFIETIVGAAFVK